MLKQIFMMGILSSFPMMSAQADVNNSQDLFDKSPMFKHFKQLQKDMDKVFEDFNKDMFKGFAHSPSTDLKDKGDKYELKMDLPGMDDKSIKIEVEDNYLNVIAKSEVRKEKKEDDKIIQQERHVGMVQRGMTLPKDADVHQYKSDYKNGVLVISIPKKK